jgi:hypothetical protein
MSDAMFAALKDYCTTNNVLPTALGRTLLAQEINFDLAKDPDAPGSATRTRYATDAAREDAKTKNRAYNRLLRKALYQAHLATTRNRPALAAKATDTVRQLSDKAALTLSTLEALDTALDEAIRANA